VGGKKYLFRTHLNSGRIQISPTGKKSSPNPYPTGICYPYPNCHPGQRASSAAELACLLRPSVRPDRIAGLAANGASPAWPRAVQPKSKLDSGQFWPRCCFFDFKFQFNFQFSIQAPINSQKIVKNRNLVQNL
jgi:hypothetical protein